MTTLAELHTDAAENGELETLLPSEGYIRDSEGFIIPADGFLGVVTVVEARFGQTAKGNPSLGMQLQTEDNIRFWTNIFFSDNPTANQISFRQLKVLGVTEDFINEGASNEDIIEKLVGQTVTAKVSHDEGDMDKVFIRVSFRSAPVEATADTF